VIAPAPRSSGSVQPVGQAEALKRTGEALGVEWLLGEALVRVRLGRLG
jgi:hypothetical protein